MVLVYVFQNFIFHILLIEEYCEKNIALEGPPQQSAVESNVDETEVKVVADRITTDSAGKVMSDSLHYDGPGDVDVESGNIQQGIENLNLVSGFDLPKGSDEHSDSDDGSDGGDSDYDKSEREVSEKILKGETVPENKLRSYQQELADKALRGKNTIICADTNSGKTRVALYIANRILESPVRGNRKVVFMARTNPLVRQQFKLFKAYLPAFKVCLLSKEDINSTKMNLVLIDHDVFFMTPQILVNNLKTETVKMSMFVLMILDECHHTSKGEPYNTLMRQYIKEKIHNPCDARPQIIGLTATIGVGDATHDNQAVDYMLKICANLDVETIATVEDNIEEMRKYTSRPKEEQLCMEERPYDPCKDEIIQTMKKVEEVLDRALIKVPDLRLGIADRRLNDYQSKKYQQWLVITKDKTACVVTYDKLLCREIISSIEHLLVYNEALDINYLMNEKYVLEYLSQNFEKETTQQDCLTEHEKRLVLLFEDLQLKLLNIHKSKVAINPNLNKLVYVLREKFKENGVLSRGIVFVQTRATAFALSKYLESRFKEENVKCRAFTGNKTSENKEGMGENQKKELLENFKSGEIKLLVSTSVGSEGIDIPECNIVLKYNYSGNEVSVIQMRGRLRKEGGTTVHFGDYTTRQRDTINMQKALMMYRALEMLKKLNPAERKKRIDEYQRQDLVTETAKQITKDMKEAEKPKIEFEMRCLRCKITAVTSDKIRKYADAHHVVTDPSFFTRIKKKPLANPQTFDNMTKHSKVFCQKCPKDWGVIFMMDDCEVPVIKSESFVFHSILQNRDQRYKKWKDVPYHIESIEKDELLQLLLPVED